MFIPCYEAIDFNSSPVSAVLDGFALVWKFVPITQILSVATAFRRANNANKSTLDQITESQADCHITTWWDSTLYSGIVNVLAVPPGDLDFLTGEQMRNLPQ
ncbi:hypothetical protein V8E55_011773 [Tylopilus felleus]